MATTLFALCFIKYEYVFLLTVGLVVIFIASLIMPNFRQAVVVPLSLASAVFACLLFVATTQTTVEPVRSLENQTAECEFYVIDNGTVGDRSKTYSAKIVKMDGKDVNFKSALYLDKRVNLRPYTMAKGKLKFYSVGKDGFSSYGKYADGIYISAKCNLTECFGERVNSPMRYVVAFRQNIRDKLSYLMAGKEGGLSVALITGDKSYLDRDVKTAFMYSGTSHIMAVSGLHLSVIIGTLLFILKKLKISHKISSLVCIASVILYMGLAGFSGSVTRAGIMLIVMLSAGLFSMRGDNLNSLGVAVTIMCIFNPYCVTDVGTVLSVLSVLSLLTLNPFFSSKLQMHYADPLDKTAKEKFADCIYSVFRTFYTSVCVFLFTIPVLYMFFGYTSIVGMVSNLLAVPLGSLCVVMSFLTYFVSLLGITPLTAFAVLLATKCNALLIKFCMLFKALNNSVIAFDYVFGLCLAGVLVLVGLAFVFGNKQLFKRTAVISLAVVAVCMSVAFACDYNSLTLRVFSHGATVCSYKGVVVAYGVNTSEDFYTVSRYLQNNAISVDYLVTQRSYSYPAKLSNYTNVNTLLCDEFEDCILVGGRYNNLEVQNSYNVSLDDSFAFCYNQGDMVFHFNGATIGSTDDCDFKISSSKIVDSNGIVELDDNPVVYKINDKNSFKVRRLNQWQK